MKDISALDFATMLNALAHASAFPTALSHKEPISVIQTHASAVLLTTRRVYKVKKPKNFGFFDYSTPALRRYFCQQEVRLNRDLSRAFVNAYIDANGDEVLRELLPFYCCYRACVRGKVFSFQLDEPEVPEAQQKRASQTAVSLFTLAAHYTSGPTKPTLVMIGGLMGTGKSTLALALQHELGWNSFSSDTVRKQLAHIDAAQPLAEAFGQGVYTLDWTARTYDALRMKAGEALALGRSVLLDASFIHSDHRQMMAQEARTRGATVLFVETTLPLAINVEHVLEALHIPHFACSL